MSDRNDKPGAHGDGIAARIKSFVIRSWALVVMLAVLGVGAWAVRYLYVSIFEVSQVSDRLRVHASALTIDDLRTSADSSYMRVEPRVPIGHYHSTDRWFQPDPRNGCLTSGCHTPLPHARSVESRAFANSHAMFLDCMVCHDARISGPVQAGWLSVADGTWQASPASLRLARYLEVERARVESDPAAAHEQIVPLLEQMLFFADEASPLHDVNLQLTIAEPGSPVWNKAVRQLDRELALHVRGEYGAKIALKASESGMRATHQQLMKQTTAYLRLPKDSAQRDDMLPKLHINILGKPGACLMCHTESSARLDFAALGYSPKKIESITGSLIVRQMQHIRDGIPFYLPSVTRQGDNRE